ncbi:MAG: M23 family metallopeptidase [Sphingomonadales bacterium]|nr:M23 family metallopeptidase [Sphingomonadales bacterium]
MRNARGLLAATILLAACTAEEAPPERTVAVPIPAPPPPEPVNRDFVLEGALRQGGVVVGRAPDTTTDLRFDGELVELDEDNRFLIAFGRDYGSSARLVARLAGGETVTEMLSVVPGDWDIEHVNASPSGGVGSAEFRRRRAGEIARINDARAQRTGAQGWRQRFLWPVTGRISGAFGSQRIYRGEPGSYHTGVDVARPAGTAIVAPADGTVILAATDPFTLEGHLLMIDHGMGLNSAFLHLSRIDVGEGVRVVRGQTIGAIGSSGRATGPHLHWSMKWRDQRIDPYLLAGPMPVASD